jgi:hypothetical protein
MADSEVNIKITAEDKATPAIAKTAKSLDQLEKEMDALIKKNNQVLGSMDDLSGAMSSTGAGFDKMVLAAGRGVGALGDFAGGASKVTTELGYLIGTGGLAGLRGLIGVIANIDEITSGIADWALGLSELQDEFEKTHKHLEAHLKDVKAIRDAGELPRRQRLGRYKGAVRFRSRWLLRSARASSRISATSRLSRRNSRNRRAARGKR